MALTKKSVELPLVGGLDTKTDPKQLKLGKLLEAQNVSFRKPGKIMKRDGFQSLGTTIIDTTANISDGQAIMTYKDELLTFDKNNVYSYISATNNWKDKGDFVSAYIKNNSVSSGNARDYMNDSAYYGVTTLGLEGYVFMRESNSVKTLYYQVHDSSTKQIIVGPVAVSTTAFNPRIVTCGDVFVIYYYDTDSQTLKAGALPISNLVNPILFADITQVSTGLYSIDPAYPVYDVLVSTNSIITNGLYVVYNNLNAGFSIAKYELPQSTYPAVINEVPLSGTRMRYCQLFKDDSVSGGGIGLVYTQFTAPIFTMRQFLANLGIVSATAITLTGETEAIRVSAIQSGNDVLNPNIRVFVDSWNGTRRQTRAYSVGNGLIFSLLSTTNQLALASKTFLYNDKAYINVLGGANPNDGPFSYFVIDEKGQAIGRYFYNIGTIETITEPLNSIEFPHLSSVETISSTEFFTSVETITSFGSINGVIQTSINSPHIDFYEPEKSYARAQIGETLYIGGGLLYAYDGQNLVEDAYNWEPQIASMTPASVGTTYTYSYVAVWEWVDNVGNLHRSAPSNPYTIQTALPLGAPAAVNNIQCWPLSLTYKTPANNRAPVMCVLYRTKANSGNYYKLPVTNANINTTTNDYITPQFDATPDTDLIFPLYTTDDVQQNDVAPPIGALTIYRNRLFALDSTNPLVIYYSKFVNFANPVEWAGDQTIYVDPTGGPVTALAAMDDKLLIFKESSVRYISGNGPDSTGANNDYGSTTLITSDAGCINARSICNTPEGIIFKSAKGVYFINRGLQVSYIGAPVEAYNSQFVSSAVLMTNNNQVRLTLDNSTFIVYDYYVDNWLTFTQLNAVDSVIWNDEHTFIGSVGKTFVETPGTYKDDGVSYPMEIMTGWVNVGGIQGFQRLWNIQLLGAYKSNHTLQTQLYYNYNDAAYQTINVEPIIPNTYGGGSPYGSPVGEPYGGSNTITAPYQYELRPKWEKCMSFKLKIMDTPVEGELSEGYELSNIRLSYGIIGGSNRLKNGQTFG